MRANGAERNEGDERIVLRRYSRQDHRPVFFRSGQGHGDREVFRTPGRLPAGNF